MIFEIAVGGRLRTVSVIRKGALLHVTLDGATHVVDARRVSDSALSLLVRNGKGDVLPIGRTAGSCSRCSRRRANEPMHSLWTASGS